MYRSFLSISSLDQSFKHQSREQPQPITHLLSISIYPTRVLIARDLALESCICYSTSEHSSKLYNHPILEPICLFLTQYFNPPPFWKPHHTLWSWTSISASIIDIDSIDPNNILLKLQNNLDFVDANEGVCMVAFLFADKPPNRGASVGLLKKAWTYLGEVRVSTKSNTAFAITVPDQTTASKILEGGPWNVAGFCCTAQLWPKDQAFEEIPSHRVVYWVQLHGVPLGQYSVENAKSIGRLMERYPFKCPDGVRGFLRIRLQLDARKPIPSGCLLAREEGKLSRVEFYYETQRSHILCFNCGRLGHINSGCSFAPDPHPKTGNRYAVETPNTELTLQLSPSHSLQQNFLFLSHPTHYFPCENPFNTTSHPWPTYQPKNTPISILLDPLTEPNFESPSSNTSIVSKLKDRPFFPGRKPLKLKYSQVGGIVLNPQDPDLSNTTLGKQKRVTFSDSEVSLQPHKKSKTTCVSSQVTEGGLQGLGDKVSNSSQANARGHGQRNIGNYASTAARRMVTQFPESSEHVLFLCPWTIGVWFASSLNYRLDRASITTFDEWWSALKRTVGVNTDSQSWVYTAASFICWEIWKSRCNCIFHGSVPSPEFTAEKASRAAAEGFPYSFAECGCLSSPFLGAPPIGVIKANFDGAWSSNTLQSGLGVVFRSSNETIINGVSTPCLSSSALQTEAKAALLAVWSTKDSNFSDVVFESDSLELIRSLKNDFKKANWTIFPLLIKIWNLSSQFRSLNWRWVPRRIVKEGCVLMFGSFDPHPL
ncbi:hypothetical protein DVH24_034414 [Malus domestica]|uniref:CCHC-type domain-containing protein n=1 Tax=Malus domestica TaxID=3750 RepID=A0A498IZJ1_MALDO|nr:hypothetical protein DVH24_034414 [Malus domestica]